MQVSSHNQPTGLNESTGRTPLSEAGTGSSLFDLLYAELHCIAARELRDEGRGHTLQTTALVHEAFVKLQTTEHAPWKNRAHFLAEASVAMRRILVDHARAKLTDKRGGGWDRIVLDETTPGFVNPNDPQILDLDHALTELATLDARQASTVTLRYFGGCTIEETAAILGVSPGTVSNDWHSARAWLQMRLAELDKNGGN